MKMNKYRYKIINCLITHKKTLAGGQCSFFLVRVLFSSSTFTFVGFASKYGFF